MNVSNDRAVMEPVPLDTGYSIADTYIIRPLVFTDLIRISHTPFALNLPISSKKL